MDYMQGLNEQQREAVLTDSQHTRIIAGAGSGKTRVLTTRLVHLVKDLNYDPRRLCAITFTNKAANEMKDRLMAMLDGYSEVHVSTIHSLCVLIIRIEHEAIDLPRGFTVLDTADQNQIMKEAYDKLGYSKQDLSYRECLNYISNHKMAHISADDALSLATKYPADRKKSQVYKYYEDRLIELKSLDFDGILLEVYYLLKDNKAVLERWQNRFDVLCVDEFQDVDEVQYGIVRRLAGKNNDLYVVGDPDQTIYSWRGANVKFISTFDTLYPDARTIVLNKNYRSTQSILSHANALIQHNKNRPHKDLVAHNQAEDPVVYQEFLDAQEEAEWIARKIHEMYEKGTPYLDIAILYRSNYLSRVMEQVFSRHQIPYVIYGGQSFYDRMEIKDMIAYLRMISHGDDLALRRAVAKPRRGIGEKSLASYANRAEKHQASIYQMMLVDVESGVAKNNIKKFVDLIESFKEQAHELPLNRLMELIFTQSGLKKHYEDKGEDSRIDSVRELWNDAASFIKDHSDADLIDYLQMISLYTDKEEQESADVVRLMTIHAAKGLEFNTVFVMGLSDGVFPNRNSISEGTQGIEEERRLMYVAITRAKSRLFISNNSGFSFVLQGSSRPSRFIKEMDIEKEVFEMPSEYIQSSEESLQIREHRRSIEIMDVVIHEVFGEGIVINIEDDKMTVAFNFPHGTKTIAMSFAGIKRKGV
ncbi:ATP-dependent helicase [Erysipelothrix urinaevulpis]|uniref:ATP-dependent helicase n=1 Tax=Erysipelothrix urinaevulpis TaxID=2683717 RepID=UPI0013589CC8|nr:UvrD-helicase domain-containing protein [Erysipelothrix urinaevulpis]